MKYLRIVLIEIRVNAIKLIVVAGLLSVFGAIAIAMVDYSLTIPEKFDDYIKNLHRDIEFSISASWMDEEKLDFLNDVVEKYNCELIDVSGQDNHISAMVITENFQICKEIVTKCKKVGIEVYSYAYEIIQPIYDDVYFFENIFASLALVMVVAFIFVLFSTVSIIMHSRRRFVSMLNLVGYEEIKIMLMYMLTLLSVLVLSVIPTYYFAYLYEKYVSKKMGSLFGSNFVLNIENGNRVENLLMIFSIGLIAYVISFVIIARKNRKQSLFEKRVE